MLVSPNLKDLSMVEQTQQTQEAVASTPQGTVRNSSVSTASTVTGASMVARIINYAFGILLSVLAIRFVLSLLGANQGNPFADFIYSLTYPFVAPFFGLFGYTMKYGVARFELETVVAMAVYALVAFALVKLVTIKQATPAE